MVPKCRVRHVSDIGHGVISPARLMRSVLRVHPPRPPTLMLMLYGIETIRIPPGPFNFGTRGSHTTYEAASTFKLEISIRRRAGHVPRRDVGGSRIETEARAGVRERGGRPRRPAYRSVRRSDVRRDRPPRRPADAPDHRNADENNLTTKRGPAGPGVVAVRPSDRLEVGQGARCARRPRAERGESQKRHARFELDSTLDRYKNSTGTTASTEKLDSSTARQLLDAKAHEISLDRLDRGSTHERGSTGT